MGVFFRRLLKEEEIIEFQRLIGLLSDFRMVDSLDRRIWSLEASGVFWVKFIVTHLSVSSTLEKQVEEALWTAKNPHRVNITVWIPELRISYTKEITISLLVSFSLAPLFASHTLKIVGKGYSVFFI